MTRAAINQPLELYKRHELELNLVNPSIFDTENALFAMHGKTTESAVVFLPKSKPLIDMTLALVSKAVKKDGTIVLVGANDAGIGSAKKLYEANIGPVEQKIVGNHSAMYVGKNKQLGADKKLEDFLTFSPITYKGVTIETATLPGIFSAGSLDEGTKLLLESIPFENKKVLDLACGSGIVGALYKKLAPKSEVTMSDISPLAIFATEKTVEKNKIKAQIISSDVFSNISDKPASPASRFDIVLVNPPFHTGVGTDYSFIEKFSNGLSAILENNGVAYMVANSFLPYERTLEKDFIVEKIIDTNSFKILKIKRQLFKHSL